MMPQRRIQWSVLLALAAGMLTIAYLGLRLYRPPVEGWDKYEPLPVQESEADRAVKAEFLAQDIADEQRYETLFFYVLDGFVAHAAPHFEAVHYPGMASIYGYRVNGIEGFARTATLLAAWLHGGRGTYVSDPHSGKANNLIAILREGILTGTNPKDPAYWGRIGENDQRIIEAADIARILWLTRSEIWDRLTAAEKKQVASWLLQVNSARLTFRNNWVLFPIVVNTVLYRLGYGPRPVIARAYEEFKERYRESGWFRDSRQGVDFYNVWGIPYELYWIHALDPNYDEAFIRRALHESALLTAHLISPKGIPIMGRSICYRTAVSTPLIIDHLLTGTPQSAALARRALDVSWRYFVGKGALREGALTQGYFDPDPRFVDPYIGPGSCNWGLRPLVLALMQPHDSMFWRSAPAPLPIEFGDYRIGLPKLGWTVAGTRATGNISIIIAANTLRSISPQPYSPLRRLGEWLLHRPMRPRNETLKYGLREYSSRAPFPAVSDTP